MEAFTPTTHTSVETTAGHAAPPSFEELRAKLNPPYDHGDFANPRWLYTVIPCAGVLAAACFALSSIAL